MLWLWSRLCQENISHEERNRLLINAILNYELKDKIYLFMLFHFIFFYYYCFHFCIYLATRSFG